MIGRVLASILILLSVPAYAGAPSVPGVDAPELAALGRYGIGFRSVTFIPRCRAKSTRGPAPCGKLLVCIAWLSRFR